MSHPQKLSFLIKLQWVQNSSHLITSDPADRVHPVSGIAVASVIHVEISNEGERAFYAQLPAVKRLTWLTWTVPQSDSGSWLSLLTHCLFPTPPMEMERELRSVLKISTGSMRPLSFSAEIQWGHGNIHYLEIWLPVTIHCIGEQIQS